MNLDLREIPAVYINLERHTEKNESMQNLLNECGFKNIIRVEGVVRPDNPIAGCSAAHYKALHEINPPFILFEDDCVIKNFRPEIEIPDDADAVYLGISSWGRMNGHSGPFVQYDKISEYENLVRVYNMLSGHAIVYLSGDWVEMARRCCYHAGYVIESYYDVQIAEVQRFFNIYACDDPMFYQTSSDGNQRVTYEKLSNQQSFECFSYSPQLFLPERIK